MSDVTMPRLSDSMEEGTILKWLKADGDTVRRGEALVEIETDKANMTYESDAEGALAIVAPEGETLPIGALIARIGDQSDDGAASAARGTPTVADQPAAKETAAAVEPAAGGTGSGREHGGRSAGGRSAGGRVKVSPVARRVAREQGVELTSLHGSGPGGRIVRSDVESAAADGGGAGTGAPRDGAGAEGGAAGGAGAGGGGADDRHGASAGGPAVPGTAKGELEAVSLTRTQQLVARRMAESRATIPDFTLSTDIDMQACVELRAQLAELPGGDPPPSYNDMVVKACGLALREFPRANGSYRDASFELHSRVNVGIAVAANDTLVVPTVFDADSRSLAQIARDTRALAGRVRDATITPPELSGATFTVSNLGMYGVTAFSAVINPPQAAILAVGALAPRAVVRGGALAARHTMTVTLSCDHRILYGAEAARFLARVRALLERPLALLL